MAAITCKLSYGDETRRFKLMKDEISYKSIHLRATSLFDFPPETEFKLQYKDDEGDLITMSTDPEMREAIDLVYSMGNPILRLTVKIGKSAAPEPHPTESETKGEAKSTTPAPPDLSALLKNINQELPKIIGGLPGGACGGADLHGIFKNVSDNLPPFIDGLPKCVREQMHNAEVDVAATIAANAAAKVADVMSGKAPDVTFSVMPADTPGYGDKGVHPGVTCDKSGMCPIVGPRYNLKGHNYDLCEAEFNKLEPSEQAKFVKIEAPGCFGREPAIHHGVTCDKSGMCPIVGPRYNLKGHNYDLCEAEFNKLEPSQQAKYEKIERSVRQPPWRPRCGWGRMGPPHASAYGPTGFCGGGNGFGGGGGHCNQGQAKLAARFVTDVTIFDGTQMAPSTPFTKIWRLKNVGDTPWPAGTKLLFVGGDRMAAEMTVPVTADNKSVMPGEEVDVAVDMVAPPELGRYLGYWRLTGPLGRRRFGQRVWAHIQVVDPSSSAAAQDPKALEAEMQLMDSIGSGSKGDPFGEDDDDDEAMAAARAAASAVSASAASAAALCSSGASSSSAASSGTLSGLSSAVSSTTSSAVSVKKADVATETHAATAEEPADKGAEKEEKAPAVEVKPVPADEPTPDEPKPDEPKPDEPKEVSTAAPSEEERLKDHADVATELLQMGFNPKTVEMVIQKHAGVYPMTNLLETCSRELVQLSEWDEMLSDLEEMGFDDREKNTRLMIKNDGSVKRTVKDLVADAI